MSGTDANTNGVRDDVERSLATRLGASPVIYNKAIQLATNLQSAMTSSGVSGGNALAQIFSELNCREVTTIDLVLDETVNNKERYEKYIEAYIALIEQQIASGTTETISTTACE